MLGGGIHAKNMIQEFGNSGVYCSDIISFPMQLASAMAPLATITYLGTKVIILR